MSDNSGCVISRPESVSGDSLFRTDTIVRNVVKNILAVKDHALLLVSGESQTFK